MTRILSLDETLGIDPRSQVKDLQKQKDQKIKSEVRAMIDKVKSETLPNRLALIGSSGHEKKHLRRSQWVQDLLDEIDRKTANKDNQRVVKLRDTSVRNENIGLYGSNSTEASRKLQRGESLTSLLGGLIK